MPSTQSHQPNHPQTIVEIGFSLHIRPHLRHVLAGIQRFARAQDGWQTALTQGLGRARHQAQEAAGPRVRTGLITGVTPESRDQVAASGVPTVLVGPGTKGMTQPWVGVDDALAAQEGWAFLRNQGWGRVVAFIHGDTTKQDVQRFRRGYEAAARTAGQTPEVFTTGPRTAARGRWVYEDHVADLVDFLRGGQLPVGVVTSDEEHAWRTIEACRQYGLDVPGQVAVVARGGDHQLAELTDPPLTTIPADLDAVGYAAGGVLDRLLRGEAVPAETLVPPGRVIERATSGLVAVDDPDVAAALRFIDDHLEEPIGIHHIAEAALVSPRTLHRRFEAVLGKTPGAVLRRARVKFAERLLVETDRSLADIAAACGMGLPSQFGRDFKRATGSTPAAFRAAHRR